MKKEKKWMKNSRLAGFTLVELIVVLVILSILTAVAVPSVLGFIDDSKEKECRSQVEALTADVVSAKMAYEANGEIDGDGKVGGDAFDVQEYINKAGDEGRCPVDDVVYVYKQDEHKIVCPNGHGEGFISGSGKFTVAVVEDTEKREAPDVVQTYKAQIQVESGSTNMKPEEYAGLHVTVTDEHGNVIPDENVTVTWIFPNDGSVQGTANGTRASLEAEKAGSGQVSCTVTVTKEDGTTETVPCGPVDITVTDPKPEPSVDLTVPESVDLETGSGKEVTASVTPNNLDGKDVKYTYEWGPSDPGNTNVKIEKNAEDGSTVTVTGETAGEYDITCKVTGTYTDEYGNEQTVTDEKTIHVSVTDPKPEPSVDLTVPESVDLETGSGKEVTASVTPNNLDGKDVEYTYEWGLSDPGNTNVKIEKNSEDGSTVTVTGETAGEYDITCKVTGTYTDENGNVQTVTDEKTIHVSVTESKTETPAQPELNLEVPSLTVEMGKPGQLEPKATGGSGKYTYKYESLDENTVTVDENGNVTGVKPGKAKVKVTVTDDETKATKTVEVEVSVTQNGGLFNPREMHFWADDAASVELHKDEYFQRLMAELPKGTWSLYSGDVSGSSFNNGEVKLHPTHYDESHCCTGPFILKYVTDDGVEDYLTVTIGYPIHTVEKPSLTNNDRTIGEEVTCNTVLEPKHTTDGPVEWEIDPDSTAKIELSYVDDKCINVKMKMLSAGQFRIRAKVYRQREKDKGYVYSAWSDWDKVKYPDLKQITIPSKIDIEEGALMDIAIQTEPNDVGPLAYDYQVNSEYFEMKDGKLFGKKSTGDQRYELRVTARQEGGQTAQAVCQVKVFPRKEGETFIDGHQFKATSWEAFQKAVEANGNYQINRKNYVNQDSPIYYDDIKDAVGNIIGRRLYVALGTDKNYDTDAKRKDVKESDSFEMYISKGHSVEFVEISTPIQLAATVDWDDLGNDPTKYDKGAIVKVIHGSEVEYYIAISISSGDRVLNNISSIKAWWKLNVLP